MKKLIFVFAMGVLAGGTGFAACKATITVDNPPIPDTLVTNDCLGPHLTLKWQAKGGGPWSTIFSSTTPCWDESNKSRKHFGTNPDGDGKKHDTCTINNSTITSGTNCPGSYNLLCFSYDYYPNANAEGKPSDPQVIVD